MDTLPPYLLNAWRLDHRDEELSVVGEQLKGWYPSSLAGRYLKTQLDKHFQAASEQNETPVPSLSSLTVGKVLDELLVSEDLMTSAKLVADSLSFTTFRQLLEDPRMPYNILRVFCTLSQTPTAQGLSLIDVDEAIIQNERYIRSCGDQNQDGKYLVSIEDICSIVSETATKIKPVDVAETTDSQPLTFKRKTPPKGGFEVLDYKRPKELSINRNNVTYSQVFDRITKSILRGLDWTNIVLAGGMALTTLLHVDPSKDDHDFIQDPDLDLYIYGVGPEEANVIVEQIHDTWARNLPPTEEGNLVVKNAKTINLISSYPNRRIQIVLKLLPTPTDVLLNFDLDACAIGFDGSRVFMLPRCARAIETGYSTFTMDLVWGHHLGDRRASQDVRIFKYANRGFGIRFLPSYARSLEEDDDSKKDELEATTFRSDQAQNDTQKPAIGARSLDDFGWRERERKPHGDEPGLKTLKRIAYLGQDFVHRYYFGVSPLAISPKQLRRQLEAEGRTVAGDPQVTDEDDKSWRDAYEEAERDSSEWLEAAAKRNVKGSSVREQVIRLCELDTKRFQHNLPNGRRGLANLEVFMRHCEAWRFCQYTGASLVLDRSSSLLYDEEIYDDLPTYEWNEDFVIERFTDRIQKHNDDLWYKVKEAICKKLGIARRMGGYANYSTRRIRRQVYGPDFKTVQEKQITIPINIPWSLENYLLSTLPSDYDDLPPHFLGFKPLIPVHDPRRYDPTTANLPSLGDIVAETGNLRYWVITNESMWACQHRVMDEFAELMWTLFHWFNISMSHSSRVLFADLDRTTICCWRLARSFKCRMILPNLADETAADRMRIGLPSLRETLLFKSWALHTPATIDGALWSYPGAHPLYQRNNQVLYPFPDELFWDPNDADEWVEGGGAPEWTLADGT